MPMHVASVFVPLLGFHLHRTKACTDFRLCIYNAKYLVQEYSTGQNIIHLLGGNLSTRPSL